MKITILFVERTVKRIEWLESEKWWRKKKIEIKNGINRAPKNIIKINISP